MFVTLNTIRAVTVHYSKNSLKIGSVDLKFWASEIRKS